MTDLSYNDQLRIDSRYQRLADSTIVFMTADERKHAVTLVEHPTWDFKRLALLLAGEGCAFPKQQAALMLRNTPGVAAKLLEDAA